MNIAIAHIIANWKTTLSSILTTLLATGTYFAAVPTAILQQNGVSQQEIFWATCTFGVAKIILGLLQKDGQGPHPPGTVITTPPIAATESAPAVPATSTTITTR